MEHGQTLEEYVKINDFEVPAVFTFVPIINLAVVVVALFIILWNFINKFKKP